MMKERAIYDDINTGQFLFEGQGCLVHNRKVNSIGTLLGWLIRKIQGTYWNHMVTFVDWQGELWVFEATERGVMPTKSVHDWLKQCRAGYRDYRLMDDYMHDEELILFRQRVKEITGKSYDFASLLYFHPIKLLLDRWFPWLKLKNGNFLGHTGNFAKKSWYCSESYGYLRNTPFWWKLTPEDFNKMPNHRYTYKHGLS